MRYKGTLEKGGHMAALSLTETVGFEPTCPCGQIDFESISLRPLRYVSRYYYTGNYNKWYEGSQLTFLEEVRRSFLEEVRRLSRKYYGEEKKGIVADRKRNLLR